MMTYPSLVHDSIVKATLLKDYLGSQNPILKRDCGTELEAKLFCFSSLTLKQY